MAFTVLDLAPILDPLFTKCSSDVQGVRPGLTAAQTIARLKATSVKTAMDEINRQGAIYTREETAYVNKIKRMHQEAKALSATLVDLTNKLNAVWDKKLFEEMPPKMKYIHEMATEAHKEMQDAVAHQGWRAKGWNYDLGTGAVGDAAEKSLEAIYLGHRAPMIAATADLKTFVVKLDEFAKRADDCLKTAASLSARAGLNVGQLTTDAESLAEKAKEIDDFAKGSAVPHRVSGFQKLSELLGKQKQGKIDAAAIKLAEQVQQAAEILDKDKRTEIKTLTVQHDNIQMRAAKSPPIPTVAAAMQKADTHLKSARKVFDAFGIAIANHKKKIVEAKARH